MASRKATQHRMSSAATPNPSSVQIKTFVDANKSIDKLISVAKANNDGRIYDKRQKGKFPSAYYTPLLPPRGSSAGHSPQGSADEMHVTGRTPALSPSTTAISSPQMPMLAPCHRKQASAPPELDTRDFEYYSNRPMGSQHPQPMIVHHQQSKSISAIPTMQEPYQQPSLHIRSYSHEASHFSQSYGGQPPFNQEIPQSNMYDPRAKSQSHDALTLCPMPDIQPQRPQVPDLERLGPLPPNWEYLIDEHGNAYFADHSTKTTTWYDPRQLQEDTIRNRHGYTQESQANYYPQQPQHQQQQQQQQQQQHFMQNPNDYNASTYQRVQQLENERNTLQERQEQLLRSGLLDNSPGQYGNAQSPLQQTTNLNMRSHDYQFGSMGNPSQPQQSQPSQPGHMMNFSCENSHRIASGMDSGMDVDYPASMNTLDPSFSIADINPHEFDKYLQLSDHHHRTTSASNQQMIPRYP